MKNKTFWENFILVAVFLAVIQTLLDDLSIYMQWSVSARNALLVSALAFDFIFTVEFAVRSILAGKRGPASEYWIHGRGWADFLSSIPLLALCSLPSVLLLFFSGAREGALPAEAAAILNAVVSVQAFRILRLVRVIKIFGKIRNSESPMTLHHTSAVAATSVFTMICVLVVFSLLTVNTRQTYIKEIESNYKSEIKKVQALREDTRKSYKYIFIKLFKSDPGMLKAVCEDVAVLSNISDETITKYYNKNDYIVICDLGITVYASLHDINKKESLINILHFFIITAMAISFMTFYTRHFDRNITGIINVMDQGFRKRSYNLKVDINEAFKDHEVFTLARFYNDAYIPAKMRKLQKEEEKKNSVI